MPPKKKEAFSLQATRVHLTYRGHLDFEKLHEDLSKTAEIKHFSFVWESSDKETPYDHTHALVWFKKRCRSKNPRIFDVQVTKKNKIHPNIQIINTDLHWDNTWKYHEKAACQTLS